ncbi:DedA family protein [Allostreptomyces psammosilenae]|uniref:Membrane protein DedA with SNARE-associated domain n=1 Tax=Allostreptomyces psammosilenae TaxID=1892865 RepID=A0A853A6T6_9ACTN|nr:DedA family protein [Allostreptomyces psammosilenae]NYI06391.1 membrane protein DedA with SNARE-associated domain [Allostreptomyces psammosilenae]
MLTDLLDWLQGLPQPALVAATGLLVFAECTIGLGFVAPGETGLFVASTTATTVPRFLTLWVVVTVCAAAGDSIGYAIGRRYGPRLRDTGIIRRYGLHEWDRATDLLRRRGAWAVFTARWLPVVRTLTPAAAGTSGLPYRKFAPAVVTGATLWSATHIAIGAALGEAAERIEEAISTGGTVVVVALAVVVAVVVAVSRRRRRAATTPSTPATAPDAPGGGPVGERAPVAAPAGEHTD